jgi:hypothetical protein
MKDGVKIYELDGEMKTVWNHPCGSEVIGKKRIKRSSSLPAGGSSFSSDSPSNPFLHRR